MPFIPRFGCSIRAAPQAHVDVVPPSSAHRCVSNLNDLELPREPHMRCVSSPLDPPKLDFGKHQPDTQCGPLTCWHVVSLDLQNGDFGISLHLTFCMITFSMTIRYGMMFALLNGKLCPNHPSPHELTHLDHPRSVPKKQLGTTKIRPWASQG